MLRSDGIPLYHQLKEIFQEKIASGEWAAGCNIPTEEHLCALYGVSRGPVRQALDRLVREGVLARKQGRGTWVRSQKIEGSLGRLYSFTTLLAQQGFAPASRLLSFARTAATPSVARDLALAGSEAVFRIVRVRVAGDEPLLVETVFVPAARCPDLSQSDVAERPLYTILRDEYHLPLVRARQYFEAVVADTWEAGLLQINPGAPLLLLRNITYTLGDAPIVLSKAILRGDRLRYYVDLADAPSIEQRPQVVSHWATGETA